MRGPGLAHAFLCLALACASPALGQPFTGNDVVLEQDGTDNTATIDQSGSDNTVGTEDLPLLQSGFWNELEIQQNGASNRVGTDSASVIQRGLETTPQVHNRIGIDQDGGGNLVESILQIARGAVPQGTNTLIVTQSGLANRLDRVVQDQQPGEVAQRAEITMDGERNRVRLIRQEAGTDFRVEPNRIVLQLVGVENGRLDLTGVARVPDLEDSAIVQTGSAIDPASNGNEVEISVLADGFRFGIRQGGRLNRIGPVAVAATGDDNVLGIRQEGLENDVTMAVLEGIDNVMGVDQYGTNVLALNLFGGSDYNTVSIDQMGTNDALVAIEGDTNDVILRQDYDEGRGGDNDTDLDIVGDDNLFELVLEGDNVLGITVTGSKTNRRTLSADLLAAGLRAGRVVQIGEGNRGDVTIAGDDNVFAARQAGLANTILATVTGDDNELGILQTGNRNDAGVNQSGRANTALIRQ